MSAPWDTAARLLLCGLLAWRLASVLLRAAGLVCLWAGLIELPTGPGPLAGVGALVLGGLVWLAGHRLDAYCRRPYRSLLAARKLARRGSGCADRQSISQFTAELLVDDTPSCGAHLFLTMYRRSMHKCD